MPKLKMLSILVAGAALLTYSSLSIASDNASVPPNLVSDSADGESMSYGKKKPHQTNLLFIMFDDLRVELSVYGKLGMITPNFERLAARSVVFEHAYCQIAVCNPSRDSLLTGLRPDTVGTYAFQTSYNSFNNLMVIPTRLQRSGYHTAGFGKIRHWDGGSSDVWDENFDGRWYDYQGEEWNFMNSSVMPDKVRAEETFPDHIFASKAIEALGRLSKLDQYYMVAIGFKMPHLAMHVPYKYFDMYRSRVHQWNATAEELRFPRTAPIVSFRCCADNTYRFMNDEGAEKANVTHGLQIANDSIPLTVHQEMMWGYAAMITYVDKQLGRVLDEIDKLELWGNLTVVLTADHGMHNGEKGIWEKWSLFDESTHVPLMIAHPLSPFKGERYPHPVELIDIFPTINDLLSAPAKRKEIYGDHVDGKESYRKYIPLQGKSLAPLILGKNYRYRTGRTGNKVIYHGDKMPSLNHTFALSQTWRCTGARDATYDPRVGKGGGPQVVWDSCDMNSNNPGREVSVMGYSMRTLDFRYTMYIPFQRPHRLPMWNESIFAEELYDHRGDVANDFGHREIVNLAADEKFYTILKQYREALRSYLWNEVVYVNLTTTFNEIGKTTGHRNPRKVSKAF